MTDEAPDDDIEDDGKAPTEQPTVDASSSTTLKRAQRSQSIERQQVRRWWSQTLRDPVGSKIIWGMLADLHTFEDERFACGPNGFPNPQATEHARGQRDYGLRFYRTLALHDRDALFAMHDKFDPAFAKPKTPRKRVTDE